jgi:hypothetical protein
MVPKMLTPEYKETRMIEDLITLAGQDVDFLNIITEDETSCFLYNSQPKHVM